MLLEIVHLTYYPRMCFGLIAINWNIHFYVIPFTHHHRVVMKTGPFIAHLILHVRT